ncbi:MAG TPA: hypothetical protein HA283_04710 [Nanoarchaeota archaeon]|nr:hypothetical protein [Nanoarchaeota archaeon]HIH63569.1 hypothetical protein [Nanoarchaeota archaeon]HIJ10176.1 hypothetical protein [Nanoarchaeota archaeon]
MVIKKKLTDSNYNSVLLSYPKIYDLLSGKNVNRVEKLNSRWRASNLLLRIDCDDLSYVFKQVNVNNPKSEMEKIALLKKESPLLFPELFIFENNAYLMEYVVGQSFFDLDSKERVSKVSFAGKVLSQTHRLNDFPLVDIREDIGESFKKYRTKAEKFFLKKELQSFNFEMFCAVPSQLSHNDLNAANLIYGNNIKLIDPKEETFNDVAKDVGRYCASCFFNNYDYFGNEKKKSLELAEAFLSNFDNNLLNRARYFMGESFLSFLNFDTHSDSKGVLKKLAMNLLLSKGKGDLVNLLEEGLNE